MALAAQQAAPVDLEWDWDRSHRLFVETEVELPEFVWVQSIQNKAARMKGLQIQAVLDCRGTEKESRSKRQVWCDIEAIGLVGAVGAGDRGLMLPILDEYKTLYESGRLELIVRKNGRVTDVNLITDKDRNLLTRRRRETMRLLARFLVAGMEQPLPGRSEALWTSRESLLCTFPTNAGTLGLADTVHEATVHEDTVEIATGGKGMLSPSNSPNTYSCEFAAQSFFEPGVGLTQRRWSMMGEPTPSSPIALGTAGYSYRQKGSLHRLDNGERPEILDNREIVLDNNVPSAIQQQWQTSDPFQQ